MKRDVFDKILTAIIFAVSIILSWGGLIYATNDPENFRFIGVVVSFVGYGIFFWAVLRYENDTEEQN